MFGFTALELARFQFGFTISFHIIFPAITIGLASYLAVLEALWLWKGDGVYRDLYHFWSKIFAVNFAMGVVSGLVMAWRRTRPTGLIVREWPSFGTRISTTDSRTTVGGRSSTCSGASMLRVRVASSTSGADRAI